MLKIIALVAVMMTSFSSSAFVSTANLTPSLTFPTKDVNLVRDVRVFAKKLGGEIVKTYKVTRKVVLVTLNTGAQFVVVKTKQGWKVVKTTALRVYKSTRNTVVIVAENGSELVINTARAGREFVVETTAAGVRIVRNLFNNNTRSGK